MVFEAICNSEWFVQLPIMLLFNKIDLFSTKLHYSRVSDYFPDFEGIIYPLSKLTLRRRSRLLSNNIVLSEGVPFSTKNSKTNIHSLH